MMRRFTCVLWLAAASGLVGCGEVGLEGTVPVTGTVMYQGQPVPNATIMFSPEGDTRAASGRTDADGRFALVTLKSGDGVIPGDYNVVIAKTEAQTSMSSEQALEYLKKHGRPPAITSKEILPAKYRKADTSGLTARVTEDGENDFTFELTD